MRRFKFTRKRALTLAALIVLTPVVGWFAARHSVARWAVHRALAASGLERTTFRIQSVGLRGLHITDLSAGTTPGQSAGSVDVAYTLAGLAKGRVGTIGVRDARWTVQVQDGAIDWGLAPGKTTGPLTLNMPFERVDLRDAVIRVVVDGVTHEATITGQLRPTAPDGIACRVELVALGRKIALMAQAKMSAGWLSVDLVGQAERLSALGTDDSAAPDAGSTLPQARLNATLLRSLGDGSTQVDMTVLLESLDERAGNLDIALSHASGTGRVVLDGRGQVNELTSSMSVRDLRIGGMLIRLAELNAVKLDGPRLQLEAAASGEGWELPEARGTAALDTYLDSAGDRTRSATITVDMRTSKPVSLDWRAAGITGNLGSITGSANVRVDGSGLHVLEGSLTLNGGSLQTGDLGLSEGEASVVMRSPEAVDVTSLRATVGDGGVISAEPFSLDPRAPRLQTRVSMTNLSLAEWLPLVTRDHATGEGRISGHADVSIDLTGDAPRLDHLSGALRSDPGHGFIQVTDAEALGALLDRQDPRFAADEVMRPVRDKIVAALRDFAFDTLTVDVSRQDDQTVALAYLSGFGRHGDDPQGLNVTLDMRVQDSFLDLASRIVALSKIREAAGATLDRFFEAPASEDAHP